MLRLQCAIAQRNMSEAREMLSPAVVKMLARTGRARWARAFDLLIRLGEDGAAVGDDEIDGLVMDGANQISLGGIRDYEIAAAMYHFAEAGERPRSILTDYLSVERRHRSTLSRILAAAAGRTGCLDLIKTYYSSVDWIIDPI
jgi:hypothetical protein